MSSSTSNENKGSRLLSELCCVEGCNRYVQFRCAYHPSISYGHYDLNSFFDLNGTSASITMACNNLICVFHSVQYILKISGKDSMNVQPITLCTLCEQKQDCRPQTDKVAGSNVNSNNDCCIQ